MSTKKIDTAKTGNSVNNVLPAVYFGIFRIASKQQSRFLYINANLPNNKECELIPACDIVFDTQEKAIEYIDKLPRPALYTIMPVYLCL